jgi:hypothetical protein
LRARGTEDLVELGLQPLDARHDIRGRRPSDARNVASLVGEDADEVVEEGEIR